MHGNMDLKCHHNTDSILLNNTSDLSSYPKKKKKKFKFLDTLGFLKLTNNVRRNIYDLLQGSNFLTEKPLSF